MKTLTLYELNYIVKRTLQMTLDQTYWVKAEISEMQANRHCYMELVQKDPKTHDIEARAKAQVWATTWNLLRPTFERATGQRLAAGMEILVEVKVTFHELYGFSLNIIDIDPTYTLGDMARRRMEIIQRLRDEGVFTMNKELPLPRLMKRIAVISSATAAGYGDFCNQLYNNSAGLAFETSLFPASMQGNETELSVINALNRIAEQAGLWDVVVITRGGGSTSDLNAFDSLELAENVAQFPLPVITGIGHERDDTIIDLVSHTRVKTPTAAAEFIIQHQEAELNMILDMEDLINTTAARIVDDEKTRLRMLTNRLPASCANYTAREEVKIARIMTAIEAKATQMADKERNKIDMALQRLKAASANIISREWRRIELAEAKTKTADPMTILRLGYSITKVNGRVVTDISNIKKGDCLETALANGVVRSTVKATKADPGIMPEDHT